MSSRLISRRAFLHLAAGVTTSVWLVSCAPSASPTGSEVATSGAAETSQVELIIQGWVDSAWQVTERAKLYNAEVAEGHTINVTAIPEGWETKALSQIQEGAPSWDGMLSHHPFRFAVAWLSQGLITPIDEYLAISEQADIEALWADTIAPELIQFDCSVNGQVVGVPLGIDTCCQGINAELMEQAGLPATREDFMAERSWDQIQQWAEIARETHKANNIWGINTWNVYHQSLGAIFQSIATELYYEEEGLIRFDSEEMQRALEIQSNWSWTDVAPVPAWGQPNEVGTIFPGGRSAIWQGQVGQVGAAQRALGVEKIPYAMPVQDEGGTGGNQWYTTDAFVLNKSSHPQEVVDFYLWLAGPQNDEHALLTLQYNWFPV
jgi:ABC-type glycerol-3-phosphate transport system substrate-binding protein